MSKENTEAGSIPDTKKTGRSKLKSLLLLVRISAFMGFSVFAYLLFQDLHEKGQKAKIDADITISQDKAEKKKEVLDPDLFQQSDLVDLGRDVRRAPQERFVDRFSKGDSDYIYQSLMKNQMQINDLKFQVRSLSEKIARDKIIEKVNRITLAYVDLRQDIFFNGKDGIGNYTNSIKTIEALLAFDESDLSSKIEELKFLLPDLHSQRQLVKEFDDLIADLMVVKKVGQGDDLGAAIRHNISKFVVIRKVGQQASRSKSIDVVISKIEEALKEENYQGALYELRDIDPSYKKVLMAFIDNLNTALGVQKIDREILSYLKTLS